MLTPFTNDGAIDLHGLQSLVEFYIENGVNGLFANCLSGEIHELSPDELLLFCLKAIESADGRVPVVTGTPQNFSIPDLADFAQHVMDMGVNSVVISTCQLAGEQDSDDQWKKNMETLLSLTGNIPLGTYECPVPYKRVLSRELFHWIAQTGRVYFHKDTCSDIEQIRQKLSVSKGSPLRFFNANLATLYDSLIAGGNGYSGVDANFFPELCVWLYENYQDAPRHLFSEAEAFLEKALDAYREFYPLSSKVFLRVRGVEITTRCRRKTRECTPFDLQKFQILFRDYERLARKQQAWSSTARPHLEDSRTRSSERTAERAL